MTMAVLLQVRKRLQITRYLWGTLELVKKQRLPLVRHKLIKGTYIRYRSTPVKW